MSRPSKYGDPVVDRVDRWLKRLVIACLVALGIVAVEIGYLIYNRTFGD